MVLSLFLAMCVGDFIELPLCATTQIVMKRKSDIMGYGFPSDRLNDPDYDDGFIPDSKDKVVVVTDLLFPSPYWDTNLEPKKKLLFEIVKKWKQKGINIPFFINPTLHIYVVRIDQTIDLFASKEIYAEILEINYSHEIVMKTGDLNEQDF